MGFYWCCWYWNRPCMRHRRRRFGTADARPRCGCRESWSCGTRRLAGLGIRFGFRPSARCTWLCLSKFMAKCAFSLTLWLSRTARWPRRTCRPGRRWARLSRGRGVGFCRFSFGRSRNLLKLSWVCWAHSLRSLWLKTAKGCFKLGAWLYWEFSWRFKGTPFSFLSCLWATTCWQSK